MGINTQFPVAVHILALVALFGDDLSSEFIAKSVNTNPVVIRKINALLKKAGLISVKAGVGGVVLNCAPEEITLLDVYNAIRGGWSGELFTLHGNPNAQCPVGSNIHEALSEPLKSAQNALEASLAQYKLSEIAEKIKRSSY